MVKWFVLGAVAVSTAGCGGLAGLVGVSVNVVATPPTIANGQSTTLASSNFGAVSVSGSKVVSPSATTVYTVTVQDSSGNPATNTATVTVN
jgi:hypothetical protein